MKVVGLVGASFCGSTVFGRVLSSLPGVIYPGELHWLVDKHDIPLCYMCGDKCPVYGREFEKTVTLNNIYDRVAESVGGCETLVSGDKGLEHYTRYTRRPDFYILLTREPLSHIASLARVHKSSVSAAMAWSSWYSRAISKLERQGTPALHVTLEGFLSGHQQCANWLYSHTSGAIPKGKVALPKRDHNCGGNRFGAASLSIDAARPSRRVIPQEEQARVQNIIENAVSRIQTLSFPTFGGTR